MSEPQIIAQQLQKSNLFKNWKDHHLKSYLSHFFCQINAQSIPITNGELGYFDPNTEKMTVFAVLPSGEFEIKPADDVFKRDTDKVEKLDLKKVHIPMTEAFSICRKTLPQVFPQEQLGDGFLILQVLKEKTLWNFAFITKTLKFVNLKINAEDGIVDSSDSMTLLQQ